MQRTLLRLETLQTNTELKVTLPQGVSRIQAFVRSNTSVQMALEQGRVLTGSGLSVSRDNPWVTDLIKPVDFPVLYYASGLVGTIVEVFVWHQLGSDGGSFSDGFSDGFL